MNIKRFFKIVFGFVLFSLLLSCDPLNTNIADNDVTSYTANELLIEDFPDTLDVITWNLKFGGGRIDFYTDCYGERVYMEKEEVIDNLESIANQINEIDPDILFVQEIDVKSKRSAYINQVQWLLNHTVFNYATYSPEWKGDYVIMNGVQRVNSGNAILSKWELTGSERLTLPESSSDSKAEEYFALENCVLISRLNIDDTTSLVLLSTNLLKYADSETKEKQLIRIESQLENIETEESSFIIGGTFNSLPPNSVKTFDFDDFVCDNEEYRQNDYSEETDFMLPFYNYFSAIPDTTYQESNATHYTFTSDKEGDCTRKLDYIFANLSFITNSWKTNKDSIFIQLSDHVPISVKIKVN